MLHHKGLQRAALRFGQEAEEGVKGMPRTTFYWGSMETEGKAEYIARDWQFE